MFNIVITFSAFCDLRSIFVDCTNISFRYAEKTYINIINSINSLVIFPFSNPIYSIFKNITFRKKIYNKRYIIIYSIENSTIYIHKIYDGRRNIIFETSTSYMH